jgi:hypothetical protein
MAQGRKLSAEQIRLNELRNKLAEQDVEIKEAELASLMKEFTPEGWKEESIGFPPYWKAEPGSGCRGIMMALDRRDEQFPRYHIEATIPLDCRRGPVDDGEIVTVGTGEIFTMSTYAGLPLENYMGFEVAILCTGLRKLPPNEYSEGLPRDFLVFKTFVSNEVHTLLKSRRKEDALLVAEARRSQLLKASQNIDLLAGRTASRAAR